MELEIFPVGNAAPQGCRVVRDDDFAIGADQIDIVDNRPFKADGVNKGFTLRQGMCLQVIAAHRAENRIDLTGNQDRMIH